MKHLYCCHQYDAVPTGFETLASLSPTHPYFGYAGAPCVGSCTTVLLQAVLAQARRLQPQGPDPLTCCALPSACSRGVSALRTPFWKYRWRPEAQMMGTPRREWKAYKTIQEKTHSPLNRGSKGMSTCRSTAFIGQYNVILVSTRTLRNWKN